ncbi:MAG TPA: hypothetical protein VF753_18420 [Terriglobales bacterium]
MTRLQMALVAYVALAVLVWSTISDQRLRFATLAILALFAVKTWVRRKDVMHPDAEEFTTETQSHGEGKNV